MINLEVPKRFASLISQAHQMAAEEPGAAEDGHEAFAVHQ